MPFPNNLKLIMQDKKITAEQIAEKLNVSRGTITNWSNGERFPRKESYIEDLATILNVTIQDLFNPSENEKIAKNEIAKNAGKYTTLNCSKSSDQIINIPYFEDMYACAGNGVLNFESNATPISFDRTFLTKFLGDIKFDNLHIINVIGNSMYPTIKEKEIIFINPFENENYIVKSGAIYTLKYYDEVFIKRVVNNPKTGAIVLHSDNKEEHPSIEILEEDKNNFEIIGRVVAHFDWI